jgi:sulfite reductase (NADPH) flavoprotein alpha-component
LPGGGLQLTVRQVRDAGGRLGLGSGWLTEHLPPGGELELRIRPNPGFHPPESDRPLILIGSGTGIAGLRAHLLHRIQQGHRRNWLLFGERYREWDGFYRIELEQWRRDGFLEHLDLVYSRDSQNRTYVQHRLRENGERLGEWVEQGAAIYVCGSRAGMGAAVGNVLADLLGQERLESLAAAGLYRRDVY